MRVAMIGPRLDEPGGIASVASVLLSSNAWNDVEIDYVPSAGGASSVERMGSGASDYLRFLRSLLGGRRADLYHVHSSHGASFFRKTAFIETMCSMGKPVVVLIHGSRFVEHFESSKAFERVARRVFSRVDRVACLSRDFERRILNWTEGSARTALLPNPVDVQAFACPERDPTRDRVVVLFMGFIGSRKGCWDLLAAARTVVAENPNVLFRFGGTGETDRLLADARRLGISDHIELLGWVGGEARKEAYATADVFCLPSYRECLPCSILEAMAAGLPVVATRVAGIPDAVDDGKTGLLVEPGDRRALADCLLALVSSAELRREQGRRGVERARERYDVDKVVEQYRALWTDVLAECRGNRTSGT